METAPSLHAPGKPAGCSTSLGSRLPSLDGWRGVSILMLLAAHAWRVEGFPQEWTPYVGFLVDGNLAVRFFFIISGFLITWLMQREQEKRGAVNLQHFYVRRGIRILPVYMAYLAVLLILELATPYSRTTAAWISNLTFTTNYVANDWSAGHLWSLAVEEQFYLIWPLLFVGLDIWRRPRAASWAIAIPLLSAPVFRLMAYKHLYPENLAFLFAHFSFLKYFDAIALGCGCALLVGRRESMLRSLLARSPLVWGALGAGLVLIPNYLSILHIPGRLMAAFCPSLQNFGFSMLLLQSLFSPQVGPFRFLNSGWLRQIGVLSYSLYLWQQLFCTKPSVFGFGNVWCFTFPWALLATAAAAVLSYYALELPLLNLRRRFRD